jgi:WhiB family redox-sensing transcriptional regulator
VNEEWKRSGACRNLPLDLFFPNPTDEEQEKEAKAWCGVCPVRDLCLESSLRNGADYGIWGGLNEEERRAIRRQRHIKRPKPLYARGRRVPQRVQEPEPDSAVDRLAQMLKERSGV